VGGPNPSSAFGVVGFAVAMFRLAAPGAECFTGFLDANQDGRGNPVVSSASIHEPHSVCNALFIAA
jgi:hypothetical protein